MDLLRLAIASSLAVVLLACGDDGAGAEVDATSPDSGVDAGDIDADGASDADHSDSDSDSDASAGDDASDGGSDPVDDVEQDVEMSECGPVGDRLVYVVSELRFARETDRLVSRGFDVDGVVSNASDPAGCRKPDMTTPDGVEGVDNQFAKVLPAIEAAGGQALEGLIQNAINAGDILIMLEVESIESTEEDECVVAHLLRGDGQPLLDAEGRMEDGQTFDVDTEFERSTSRGQVVDGTLSFGRVSVVVPAYVFFFEFFIPVDDALGTFTFREDGTAHGLLGGAISVDYLVETFGDLQGAGGVPDAIATLVPNLADLYPDESGRCQALSATMEFEAVEAFFYED